MTRSACAPARKGRLAPECNARLRGVLDSAHVDAVVVLRDEGLKVDATTASIEATGFTVRTQRHENNEVSGGISARVATAVYVASSPTAATAKSCVDDVGWPGVLDGIDPKTLQLRDLAWVTADLERSFAAMLRRALSRAKLSDRYVEECSQPEGTTHSRGKYYR